MKTDRAILERWRVPRAVRAALALVCVGMLAAATPERPAPVDFADPEAPVADAAQKGDVAAVRTLLREGEDVNAAQGDGMTALHWAAYQGNLELIEVLVYAGANVEATTRIGEYTPILIAGRTGHGAAVVGLLEAGADPEARTSTGVTALHFAAGAGQVDAVRALLAAGTDIEVREDVHGQTPLIFAANRGRVSTIGALVEAGADIDASTDVTPIADLEAQDRIDSRLRRERENAREALQEAEEEARVATDELVNGPAEKPGTEDADDVAPDSTMVPDSAVAVPADSAAAEGQPVDSAEAEPDRDTAEDEPEEEEEEEEDEDEEPVEERLGYGDLVGGIGGMSPLHHAAREGHFDATLALVDAGADVNLPAGGDRSTPMVLATINGHFDLALALMERGADPEMASHAGVTPLWAAINVQWAPKALYPQPKAHQRQTVDYMEFIETLLQAGVDPNAAVNRHIWFMSYNFDLLGVNMTGATPFWRAAYAVDVPAMRLLVEYGADPSIPSKKPPTGRPYDPDDEDDSGLPPVRVGGPGVYPIHAASGAGYGQDYAANSHEHAPDGWLPAVKYLVEELGADVNARDEFGYTAVHHAAARGDNDLIVYLVEQGADVTLVARNGRTTVDMANGPIQRVEPFPETIALLEGLGAKNNNNCRSCQ